MAAVSQILTVGGIMLDSVISADGRVSIEQMGGNAVYSAVGAALWSEAVAISGNVPGNYPAALLDALSSAGIDCTGVVRQPDTVSETEWFLHEADGSRLDHLYAPADVFGTTRIGAGPVGTAQRSEFAAALRSRLPNGLTFGAFRARYPVTPGQALGAAPAARIVHLAPAKLEVQAALVQAFRDRGALVSLDPGYLAVTRPAAEVEALLDRLDIFLPSERELSALLPGLAPPDALRRLATQTKAILGVKLGPRGALIFDRTIDRTAQIPVVPVYALDPVGAGDAFCGGFAAGYLATGDPIEAAVQGTVSASFAVEGFGALHALTADRREAERRRRSIRERLILEGQR